MILVTKSGWLISCRILRETKSSFWVEYTDGTGKEKRISKHDDSRKLFNTVLEAIDWLGIKS